MKQYIQPTTDEIEIKGNRMLAISGGGTVSDPDLSIEEEPSDDSPILTSKFDCSEMW